MSRIKTFYQKIKLKMMTQEDNGKASNVQIETFILYNLFQKFLTQTLCCDILTLYVTNSFRTLSFLGYHNLYTILYINTIR